MDIDIFNRTHRRIVELAQLDEAETPSSEYGDSVTDIISDGVVANKWILAVDDYGDDIYTKGVPSKRIALSGQSRRIPAVNLPSFIDYARLAIVGEMEYETIAGNTRPKDFYMVDPDTHQRTKVDDPSIDDVYEHVETGAAGDIHTFYRWIAGTNGTSGQYVACNNNLVWKSGAGTKWSPNPGAIEVQEDVVIDIPTDYAASGKYPLDVVSGKLRHRKPEGGTINNDVPTQTPGFGQNFTVARFAVNDTGHLRHSGDPTYTLEMPDTAASANSPGLVIVGTTSDIMPIGTANSIGTVPASGYLKVAAADHVHRAATATFTFGNGKPDVTYNMASDSSVDFKNILYDTSLPSVAPVAGDILSTSAGSPAAVAVWKDFGSVYPYSIVFSSIADSGYIDDRQTQTIFDTGAVNLSTGHIYLVEFDGVLHAAGVDDDIFTFGVRVRTSDEVTPSECSTRHYAMHAYRSMPEVSIPSFGNVTGYPFRFSVLYKANSSRPLIGEFLKGDSTIPANRYTLYRTNIKVTLIK